MVMGELGRLAEATGVELVDLPSITTRSDLAGDVDAAMARRTQPGMVGDSPPACGVRSSMLQDVLNHTTLELDDTFSDLIRRGQRLGVEMPLTAFVNSLLQAVQGADS